MLTSSDNMNPKGRPNKKTCIEFSSLPKSTVSQLLTKMRNDGTIKIPIERNNSSSSNNTYEKTTDEVISSKDYSSLSPRQKIKYSKGINNSKKSKTFTCDFLDCYHTCNLYSNLLKHKRIHSSEKNYLCDQCSFRTNFSNSLRVHQRLHTTERPYQCKECDYKCNSVSNLKKHSNSKHKLQRVK